MSVVIRMARWGRTHEAKYRVVAADSRKFRDGRYLECLGYYNPSPRGKEEGLVLDLDRVGHWVGNGAQPSDRVKSLIKEAKKS